jgi:hypothetical protein
LALLTESNSDYDLRHLSNVGAEIMGDRPLPPPTSGILDDLVSIEDNPGWSADAGDPFSLLRRSGNTLPLPSLPTTSDEPADALMLLSREAEAVLRNPALANTYQQHLEPLELGTARPASETTADPLQTDKGTQGGSLLDLLVTPSRISDLIGAHETLDAQQVLGTPPMPDVLHLFAGDILIAERRGITAELTRREHHLVSMDSAYLPATTHQQESDTHDN